MNNKTEKLKFMVKDDTSKNNYTLIFLEKWKQIKIILDISKIIIAVEKEEYDDWEIYYDVIFEDNTARSFWYCKQCWKLFPVEDEWDNWYCGDCCSWIETEQLF